MAGKRARTATQRRVAAWRKGLWAEWIAAAFLILKGYKIEGWRVKTPLGEIDLVARRGRALVFVEVKARRSLSEAIEAVHGRNRHRVSEAARWYVSGSQEKAALDLRFDIVALAPPLSLRHIKGAWDAASPYF